MSYYAKKLQSYTQNALNIQKLTKMHQNLPKITKKSSPKKLFSSWPHFRVTILLEMLIRSCSWGVGGLITDLIRLAFTKVGLLKSVQKKNVKKQWKKHFYIWVGPPGSDFEGPGAQKTEFMWILFFLFFFRVIIAQW